MRRDMAKVVWESSRRSGRSINGNFRLKNPSDFTDSVYFISNGKRRAYSKKTSSKQYYRGPGHTNPMREFLRKNTGRLWNDVWSEICEVLDSRNYHAWELRKDITRRIDKDWGDFYVDPESGILSERAYIVDKDHPEECECWWCEMKKKEAHKVNDDISFVEINGIWYLEVAIMSSFISKRHDPDSNEVVEETLHTSKVEVRQLNKQLLKAKDAWLSGVHHSLKKKKHQGVPHRKPKPLFVS